MLLNVSWVGTSFTADEQPITHSIRRPVDEAVILGDNRYNIYIDFHKMTGHAESEAREIIRNNAQKYLALSIHAAEGK